MIYKIKQESRLYQSCSTSYVVILVIISKILVVYDVIASNIQLPKNIPTQAAANILGRKVKVCSCICVVACIRLIINPTTSIVISIGPETLAAVIIPSLITVLSNA